MNSILRNLQREADQVLRDYRGPDYAAARECVMGAITDAERFDSHLSRARERLDDAEETYREASDGFCDAATDYHGALEIAMAAVGKLSFHTYPPSER